MAVGTLIGVGFVRIDADTSPAMKAVQGLGRIGSHALASAFTPVTAAVAAGVGALTATLASAGAAGGAFAAAVVPQFQKITEASQKLKTAEDAEEKATVAKAHAQKLAREMGVKYGQQIQISSGMSEEAKTKAQEYNKALSEVTTSTNAARKSQAIYDEKMKAMSPATRDTANAYQNLKDAVEDWSDSLSSTTMPIFTTGLNKIREMLPKLTPFVKTGAQEIRGFLSSFGEGQAGRVFSEFGKNLQANAGSALGGLLTSIKNITVGVVGMINAFMPVQKDMSGGMVELTQRFADFGANLGKSEGFATFMEQARGAIPPIKEFVSALGDVASAAGPLGGIGLLVLQVFSQIVAATPTPVLRLLIPAILAVNAGMKLYAIYQSASAAATWAFSTSVVASNGAVASSRAALLLFRIQQAAYAVSTAASTAATWLFTTSVTTSSGAVYASRAALIAHRIVTLASAAATGIATAATWAFSAAMAVATSPITLVIAALVALGVGLFLLWKKSETFRNIVKGALSGVASAAKAVGAWFAGPFVNFFTGAWNGLNNRVFQPIGRFFTQTLPGAAAIVRDRVTGAWNSLRDRVTVAYAAVRDRVLAPIGRFFTQTIPGWALTVASRVTGSWNGLRDRLVGVYGSVRNRVFSPIGNFFTRTIPGWASTVRSRVSGAWSGLLDRLVGVYNSIRNRVFSPIGNFFTKTIPNWAKTLRDRVKSYFSAMRDGIGTIWNGIKSKTKAPINWVLDKVWNKGIYKIWGKIAGWVGLENSLKEIKLLAAGGTVGRATPGVFNKPTAIVGEGNPRYPEFVIPTDPKYATRARGLWEAAGAHFYADGGILGSIKGAVGSVLDTGKNLSKTALSFLSDPVDKAKDMLMGPLKNMTRAIGSSSWAKMAARLPRMAVDGLLKAVTSVGSDLLGIGGSGGPVDIGGSGVKRWTGVVRQALGLVGQPLSLTNTTLRRMNQESGGNPRAVNLWDINAKRGYPSVGLMQVIRPTFQSHAGRFRKTGPFMYGTSINPLANVYASMRYALSAYGSLSRAYNRPGGYAGGTDGATNGWHWVGEMGPELLKLPAGARVRSHRASVRQAVTASPSVIHLTVENHGVIGSRQETLDWLTHALDQLDRLNRLPRAARRAG